MKIKEIGFVGIPVTDMAKARAFYENVLGLKPDPEMTGEKWTEYPIGTGVIAIANVGTDWRPSDQGTAAALEVESLEDAITQLKEHRIRYDQVDSPVCRMAIIQDPDGNKLIIHKLKSEIQKGTDA
jgi:predicted enzyme related to lactoylglutathione lyase